MFQAQLAMRTTHRPLTSPLSLYAWGVASLLALGCPAPEGGPEGEDAAEDDSDDDDAATEPAVDAATGPSDDGTTDAPDPTAEPEDDGDDASVTSDGPEDDGDTADDTDSGFDTVTFIQLDGGTGSVECDLWTQDCIEGEKCMPWANDGGVVWNSAKCVPLAPTVAEPGDPCTVEGSGVSGIDTCTASSMCWNVDGETNTGTCVAFCQGGAQAPVCDDPSTACTIANDGILILCLPTCDPLLQDCSEGEACYGTENGYVCAPDASGEPGAYGDPCEAINACDPGLECLGAGATPGCVSASCCTSFCDTSDPGASAACEGAGGGQECVGAFAEGSAPPGYEDVGYCAIAE